MNFHSGNGTRPALETSIFPYMLQRALGDGAKRVGVMVCGPPQMVDEVRRLCIEFSRRGPGAAPLTFKFHTEVFEY